MKAVFGKDFVTLLERKGWKLSRIRRQPRLYAKQGSSARITVPVHGNRPLKVGLQKPLMKVAGIEEGEF